jgi:aspartate carbamoyltransferase catalytic subunit
MPNHIFKVSDKDKVFLERVLSRASEINSGKYVAPASFKERSLGMIFFESSSRTSWSFQKAAMDLGLKVMNSFVDSSTSASKGESAEDTLELFLNLGFDIVVMRSKAEPKLVELVKNHKSSFKYINAGFGPLAHPTQALLDVYTWRSQCDFESEPNVLIMGDIKHSRVARSHIRLAQILGYKVGLCPLKSLGLSDSELETLGQVEVFKSRDEAIGWADIVMPLRAQKERFGSQSQDEYRPQPLQLSELSNSPWLMHPGPVVWGEDMDYELMQYSKSLVSLQQRSGVTCRAALISLMMEDD